ncbi:CTD kinase subunit gamma [Hyphodiscus hymeniophilus]|uniref:CTD kinase subunit gamma n=1 Tax=Hyphodiscus hymeniophilus TaxID=353542 RepID=A0A9P7AVV0_9HELO|nr:CTD kinase subunit gamma [Hyphodiscus hymeniophilus]
MSSRGGRRDGLDQRLQSSDLAASSKTFTQSSDSFSPDIDIQYDSSSVDNTASIPIPDRGHGKPTTKKGAMDPFEVRVRFTQHLQHLNASVTSANKAAQYAIKYRDMDEDLHSCILEQLERNSMNNRANIMYFIEHLCDMAARENHHDYVRMMQRDILRVVDAVAPEDGSGAANVKVVRKVLQGLQAKQFLLAQTVSEIEECLKERDTLPDAVALSSPLNGDDVDMGGTDGGSVKGTPREKTKTNGNYVRLDKKQIEQRIEEDRERHKRLREHIWAVPTKGDDAEFDKLWDETSELGEDDFILYEEEAVERKEAGTEWKDEHSNKATGNGE